MIGIETSDVNDVEVGCTAWSKTHHRGHGMQGGVVFRVDRDEAGDVLQVCTVTFFAGRPVVDTIVADDIDISLSEFFSEHARKMSQALATWLGDKQTKPSDPQQFAKWMLTSAELAQAGAAQFLPGAERRYRRNRQAS